MFEWSSKHCLLRVVDISEMNNGHVQLEWRCASENKVNHVRQETNEYKQADERCEAKTNSIVIIGHEASKTANNIGKCINFVRQSGEVCVFIAFDRWNGGGRAIICFAFDLFAFGEWKAKSANKFHKDVTRNLSMIRKQHRTSLQLPNSSDTGEARKNSFEYRKVSLPFLFFLTSSSGNKNYYWILYGCVYRNEPEIAGSGPKQINPTESYIQIREHLAAK